MIAFTAYGIPIPQGSMKAFMRPGMKHPVVTGDNKKTKPWRQAVVDACREQIHGLPPMEGAVAVDIVFYLPRPKSAPRRVIHPAKKPDLDKLVRAVLDALTAAGAWRDDGQVIRVIAWKRFACGQYDLDREAGIPRAAIVVSEAQ